MACQDRIELDEDGADLARRLAPLLAGVTLGLAGPGQHFGRIGAARVTLLRVEPLVVSEVPSPILAGSLWDPAPLERSLSPTVEKLETAGLKVEGHAAYGVIATEILRAAQEADLLAMTTHGRTGVQRWWFGSVAEEVLRQAACPLLVVRAPG